MTQMLKKSYPDEKLLKINGHSSLLEKDYNEFKLQYNKQSIGKIWIQRAVKTTIEKIYDKGLFDNFYNAEKVLKNFLFAKRRRSDLEKVNDDVIHWFCSKRQFKK